jgi:hypothetical protein
MQCGHGAFAPGLTYSKPTPDLSHTPAMDLLQACPSLFQPAQDLRSIFAPDLLPSPAMDLSMLLQAQSKTTPGPLQALSTPAPVLL